MSEQVIKTPFAKMTCEKTNCENSYFNRGSFKNHMMTHYQPDNFIASPLGNFPPVALFADTQKVLYIEIVLVI